MITKLLSLTSLCVALVVSGCGGNSSPDTVEGETTSSSSGVQGGAEPAKSLAAVSDARLAAALDEPQQWMTYGGSYDETRHSPLSKINRDTLQDLGIGWVYDMKKPRGVEATPIVVDGVMYVTGSWSVVYALDARTGEELWVYDPEVSGEDAAKGCCDVVNRGVAVYEGKVFVGVFDFLI